MALSLLRLAEIPKCSKIIVTAEMEGPLLARRKSDELAAVQYLVNHASSAVWVTNGGLLDGFDPEKYCFGVLKDPHERATIVSIVMFRH